MKRCAGIAVAVVLLLLAAGVAAGCGCGEAIEEQTGGQIDQAKDAAARAQLMIIKTGIQAYIATSGQPPADASEATLGAFVSPWPVNPWTQAPMKAGDGVGDYVYTPGAGTEFTLAVHLSDGSTAAAP